MSLSAEQTAQLLPYPALAQALRAVLLDDEAQVPPRRIMNMPGGGKFFVMPAVCAEVAMTKLITFVADNPSRGRPTIQGDVLVFDPQTGTRRAILHGPTVTARRTAAVSLLAAQALDVRGEGPMLIVGAGVQGHSHLEAFAQGLGVTEFWVASRSRASADALVAHASSLGLRARRVDNADAAMADCPIVVSCTSAQAVALRATPREAGEELVIERAGHVIGRVALWRIAEVGFFLHPDHWRQGLMREALGAALPHFFARFPAVDRITADTDPDNAAALGLLGALGFTETGRAERTVCVDGVWSGSVYLALDRPAG
jgi:ribosomal protein S18 acetylase RimI-like enzyme